jgi:hypothetical protein
MCVQRDVLRSQVVPHGRGEVLDHRLRRVRVADESTERTAREHAGQAGHRAANRAADHVTGVEWATHVTAPRS